MKIIDKLLNRETILWRVTPGGETVCGCVRWGFYTSTYTFKKFCRLCGGNGINAFPHKEMDFIFQTIEVNL